MYDLNCNYDSRKSFYGKTKVIETEQGSKLQSYNAVVAEIIDGKAIVYDAYSNTTLRHIKEYLRQNGFEAISKKQIENDYRGK